MLPVWSGYARVQRPPEIHMKVSRGLWKPWVRSESCFSTVKIHKAERTQNTDFRGLKGCRYTSKSSLSKMLKASCKGLWASLYLARPARNGAESFYCKLVMQITPNSAINHNYRDISLPEEKLGFIVNQCLYKWFRQGSMLQASQTVYKLVIKGPFQS